MPTLVSEVNNNRQELRESSNQRVMETLDVGHETVTTKGTRALVGATRGVLNSGMGLLGFLTGTGIGSAGIDYNPKTGKDLADRAKNAGNNKTLADMMNSNPDLSPRTIQEIEGALSRANDAQKTPEERDREAERV